MSEPAPSSSVPAPLLSKVISQLTADPELPRPNPTTSFWQLPTHPLSDVRSPTLPPTATYAIIGSGITGASIASALLNHPSFPTDANIVVLEARTLTSGATGRNGGALTTPVGYDFLHLTETLGREEAIRIGLFANRTLNLLHEIGNASAEMKDVSEVRRLRGVIGFDDVETFERAKESFLAFDRDVPEARADVEVLGGGEARERYNLKNVIGAIVHSCGACWPYRLITTIWASLLSTHKDRISIETNTPATSITYNPANSTHPYTLLTPGGPISATNIFHATNGYTSHLLPSLRGTLFPFRGTMSVHKPPPAFGSHGATQAWSFVYPRRFVDGVLQGSLYYSHQNAKSGDVFIGGEKVGVDRIFVGDDSVVDPGSRGNIAGILPRLFARGWDENQDMNGDGDGEGEERERGARNENGSGQGDVNGDMNGTDAKGNAEDETAKPGVKAIWSGIMGFTGDHLPIIGRLPASVTGRGPSSSASQSRADPTSTETTNGTPNGFDTRNEPGSGKGEFIAAGFNGYGMANCWSAGEAVAKIALGHDEEADEFLPQCYRCTEERLGLLREMGARGALGRLFGI